MAEAAFLVGLVTVAVGVGLWSIPAGLVVAGSILVGLSSIAMFRGEKENEANET